MSESRRKVYTGTPHGAPPAPCRTNVVYIKQRITHNHAHSTRYFVWSAGKRVDTYSSIRKWIMHSVQHFHEKENPGVRSQEEVREHLVTGRTALEQVHRAGIGRPVALCKCYCSCSLLVCLGTITAGGAVQAYKILGARRDYESIE